MHLILLAEKTFAHTFCILRIAQKQILLLPLWNIGLTWESRLALLESLKVLNECSCLRNKHIPKWQRGTYSSSQLKSIDSSVHFGKYFCNSHLFEYRHATTRCYKSILKITKNRNILSFLQYRYVFMEECLKGKKLKKRVYLLFWIVKIITTISCIQIFALSKSDHRFANA